MKKGLVILISAISILFSLMYFNCNTSETPSITSLDVIEGSDAIRATGDMTLYVSPTGTSSGTGTIDSPVDLQTAINWIGVNGTIWVRGGTYTVTDSTLIKTGRTNSGTSGNLKKIFAYNSEVPVFNGSSMSFASASRILSIEGNYWHIKGISFTGAGDNGMIVMGNYNTIENCKFYANRDSGLQIARYLSSTPTSEWPQGNLVLNCQSYDNYDTDNGEDADGFACKLSVGSGNVFTSCYSHHNVDDGWDLYTYSDYDPIGPVKIQSCTAAYNGTTSSGQTTSSSDGNGFKLGGEGVSIMHTVISNVSNYNKKDGFTANSNPGPIYFTGNSGTGNGGVLFKDVTNQ